MLRNADRVLCLLERVAIEFKICFCFLLSLFCFCSRELVLCVLQCREANRRNLEGFGGLKASVGLLRVCIGGFGLV